MKTTKSLLWRENMQEDPSEIYSRNRNILKYLDRLNKIKFRESQYFEKKDKEKDQKEKEIEIKRKHKKNAYSTSNSKLKSFLNKKF